MKRFILILNLLPTLSLAQGTASTEHRTFGDLIDSIVKFIDFILPIIGSIALLVFLWGLTKFLFKAGGNEKEIAEGKQLMFWGVIALFVMISFVAIVQVLYGDFALSNRPFGIPFLPH